MAHLFSMDIMNLCTQHAIISVQSRVVVFFLRVSVNSKELRIIYVNVCAMKFTTQVSATFFFFPGRVPTT